MTRPVDPITPVPLARVRHVGVTETKAAFKTTELIAYVVTVVAVLVASAVVDDPGKGLEGFGAEKAWLYVTILTAAYCISRGLAKSGSLEPYEENVASRDRPGVP